jgi:hypothetical protein
VTAVTDGCDLPRFAGARAFDPAAFGLDGHWLRCGNGQPGKRLKVGGKNPPEKAENGFGAVRLSGTCFLFEARLVFSALGLNGGKTPP